MTTVSFSDTILQFADVALGYGDFTVLSGISIEARKGQVVALMGGSGSGKTTLLRAATAQILPQSGRVTVFGQDIAQVQGEALRKLRQRMGVLFQQGALFTDLNVFENVAFPLREHTHISESQINDRVLEKLDAVGLKEIGRAHV